MAASFSNELPCKSSRHRRTMRPKSHTPISPTRASSTPTGAATSMRQSQTPGFRRRPNRSEPGSSNISMPYPEHITMLGKTGSCETVDALPLRMKHASIALLPFATSSGAGGTCSRRREIEAGAAEFGGRDAWKNRFFQEAQSPLTNAAMRLEPIDDTIGFLRTWRPNVEDENRHRTTSALANELGAAVSNDPMAYSLKAE